MMSSSERRKRKKKVNLWRSVRRWPERNLRIQRYTKSSSMMEEWTRRRIQWSGGGNRKDTRIQYDSREALRFQTESHSCCLVVGIYYTERHTCVCLLCVRYWALLWSTTTDTNVNAIRLYISLLQKCKVVKLFISIYTGLKATSKDQFFSSFNCVSTNCSFARRSVNTVMRTINRAWSLYRFVKITNYTIFRTVCESNIYNRYMYT